MPRWLSLEPPLLAGAADEHERRELSRRAKSARRTGRPTGDDRATFWRRMSLGAENAQEDRRGLL